MAYTNSNGQIRVGVRSGITNSPIIQPAFSASLLQSLYGVWNGDTTTNELDKSLFGAWNAENSTNTLDTNIYSVFTDTTTYTHTGVTSSQFGLWNAEGLGLNDKVGTNHLTSFNSATFSTDAILGTKSFTFNGSNYFGLPVNSWNFTGDFSLSFWVKSNWPGSGGVIPISNSVWVQTSPTIKYSGWDIRTSGPFPIFYGVSGGTTSFYIQSAIQCVSNTWCNVVVTKSNSVASIYVNGLLGGTSSVTGNITYATTSYPTIGAQKYSSAGVSDYIGSGSKIDDVAVWTRTLSHDDVIQIYNSGSGQSYPYTQPVSISVDKSQSLKGFVIGTGSSVVSGKTGNAISLTQSSSIILKDRSALKFTGDFSVSFWFRTPDVTTGKYLISTHDGTKGWSIYIASGNIIWSSGGSTNVTFGFNPTTLVANTWYHVAVSLTNNVVVSCYLNGVLGGQQSMVSKTITYDYWNVLHPGVIGGRANRNVNNSIEIDYRFTGTIDDINTWNRALSSNEVNQLYNGGNGVEYPYVGKTLSSPNDVVGTNHGTLIGGCTYTTGKIGNAFSFDGVNDYMELPANSMNLTGDLTISFWAYMRARDYNNIICNMDNNGVSRGFYIDSDGSYALRFVGYNSTYTLVKTDNSALFDLNVWNHFTFILKNGVGQWYKNGVANGSSGTIVYSLISGNKPIIGGYRTGNNGSVTSNKNMALDAFTIWNKAISQDEITQLYNSGTGAQYPFTGTFSSAGNQLGVDNGTLVNGCSLTTGKVGQAFTFDGVNDYVSLPNNSLNFTGDFSIGLWVYFNSLNNPNSQWNQQFIFSNSPIGLGNGFSLYKHSNNSLYFIISNGSSTTYFRAPQTLSQSTWYHIVITRKYGTTTKIFINGSEQTDANYYSGNSSTNPTYLANQVVNLSGWGNAGGDLLNGKIDAFTTWQKELTQSEITELYNSGNGKQITATPIVTNGLVLNLDASRTSSYSGSGTTWTDISGNANNGTLVNGPIFGTANGGAITFDGVNDRITLQNTNISATGNWTISSWFNLSILNLDLVNGAPAVLYSQYAPTPGNGRFLLMVRNDGTITNKFQLFLGSGTGYSNQPITGTTTVQINTTYNLVAIRNGSVFSLYLNGNLEASLDLTGTNISLLQNTSEIGGVSNGNFGWVNGKIYNTMVYNRALSPTEITQNFNATKGRFGL